MRAAGAVLRQRFGDPGLVRGKSGGGDPERAYDVVTELDIACEQLICGQVRELSPDAVVLGEEGGVVAVGGGEAPADLATVSDLWVVDPLDGTVNFAHSVPGFCVSVARYERGTPVAGAILDPLLDELFTFAVGDGARLNGEPIAVSDRSEPGRALLAVGGTGTLSPEVRRAFPGWRRMGSAALSLAYVAAGRFDAYAQLGRLAPWDLAAGVPLVLAAGGAVTTHELAPWPYPLREWSGVVAGGSPMHATIRELLASHAASRG